MGTDWKAAWQPVIDLAGRYMINEETVWAPDEVEAGAIRRWLEPLEFDSPLHTDRAVAQSLGHAERVAPAISLGSFASAGLWSPGKALFTSAERNAQPVVKTLRPPLPPCAPPYSGYFATDMAYDFLRPVTVGERLGRRGPRLLSCEPKETRVGRGAFVTFENETVSSQGDVVARMRFGMFCYTPHPAAPQEVTA